MAPKQNSNRAQKNGVRIVLATAATVSTVIGAQALAFAGNADAAAQLPTDEQVIVITATDTATVQPTASAPPTNTRVVITATPIVVTSNQSVVVTATATKLAPKQATVVNATATSVPPTSTPKPPTAVPATATKIQPSATPVTVAQPQPRPRGRSSR